MISNIKVIALDFEGTLISTVGTQVPRPGLYNFLEFCRMNFDRVVIFTAVDETEFRSIANNLSKNHYTPTWFKNIEYVNWNGEKKDLTFIPKIKAEEAVLIDDYDFFVVENQREQWIKIETFDYPFPKEDKELERIENLLQTFCNFGQN